MNEAKRMFAQAFLFQIQTYFYTDEYFNKFS
jgi:hypothetical protein